MPPKDHREYISPLLQPPLNRLFVPRPTPIYLQPVDRDELERTGPRISPVAPYMERFRQPDPHPFTPTESWAEKRARKTEERAKQLREALEKGIEAWKPEKDESIKSDPFKTIFVGRLDYKTTERELGREFERFGNIKGIRMVADKETGKPKGYAFIEYEREKDLRAAYLEADGMRLDGRRVVVDVERGRTVKGWRPRRLGGGLGRTRVGGKVQNQGYSGRDPRANDLLHELAPMIVAQQRKRSRSPSLREDRDRRSTRRE